jgi:hypothetical protein
MEAIIVVVQAIGYHGHCESVTDVTDVAICTPLRENAG